MEKEKEKEIKVKYKQDKYIFYRDWLDIIKELEPEQAMAFIIAISIYALDGITPSWLEEERYQEVRLHFKSAKIAVDNTAFMITRRKR